MSTSGLTLTQKGKASLDLVQVEFPVNYLLRTLGACTRKALPYIVLLKPRVMALVLFTTFVGMILAPSSPSFSLTTACLGISLTAIGAGAAGALNMWYDQDIDAIMQRTQQRPLPQGQISSKGAFVWGMILALLSIVGMVTTVNKMAAGLLAFTIIFYVVIYTMILKRRTVYNIVIGGIAGAIPPLIGWTIVTPTLSWAAWSLFFIIFVWQVPHFWALALIQAKEYQRASVPMLPSIAGESVTKRQIYYYTLWLLPVSLLPVSTGMSGWFYLANALPLGILFILHAARLRLESGHAHALEVFKFSLLYLAWLFMALLLDHVTYE